MVKNKISQIFPVFYRFQVYDVVATSHEFFVFILVDVDRGDQDLHSNLPYTAS